MLARDGRRWLLVGRLERERAVRPVSVVVGGVEADHVLEVAAVDDQDPVQALAAEGADPTLGVGVRVWGSDGRADDLHVLAAKDLIESVTEFAVAVVEQEPEGLLPVGEEHQQVSRLLCDPAPIRVGCARDELDPATLERDEEEDVDAGQPDRLDRQKSRRRASSLRVGAGKVANSARLVLVPVAADGGLGSRAPNSLRR